MTDSREPARVALLGVAYDGSSSYRRGAASAPPLIREALWSEAGNSWSESGLDLRSANVEDDGDLSLEAPLAGADLVEFNPDMDPSGLTAAVCGKLVRELAAKMLTGKDE